MALAMQAVAQVAGGVFVVFNQQDMHRNTVGCSWPTASRAASLSLLAALYGGWAVYGRWYCCRRLPLAIAMAAPKCVRIGVATGFKIRGPRCTRGRLTAHVVIYIIGLSRQDLSADLWLGLWP